MNNTTSNPPDPAPESQEKGGESRRVRSIRFSDSEWQVVEKAATERGMNAAKFVRHAALGVANGRFGAEPVALPSQYADLIEHIFCGTHLLVTLKRDDLIREGRGKELDELVKSTRALQESILEPRTADSVNAGKRHEQ